QPIAGKIVLVGGDGSTPYTFPLISLEDAAEHLKRRRPVLAPVFAKVSPNIAQEVRQARGEGIGSVA
ncbi:hypothetical protein CN188_30730, partial [Sinorhizobium meliloti]